MVRPGELENAIYQTGQDVIDFKTVNPTPLHTAADNHLCAYKPKSEGGRKWQTNRILRQVYAGAFAHMICSEAIAAGPDIRESEQWASGVEALRSFEREATRPYEGASKRFAEVALASDHPLHIACSLLLNVNLSSADIEADPQFDPYRESGKLWAFPLREEITLSADLLAAGLVTNTLRNGKDVLLARALAHTISNRGQPPSASILAAYVGSELTQLEELSMLVGPVFEELLIGREAFESLQARLRQIARLPRSQFLYSPKDFRDHRWGKAIEDYLISNDPATFAACNVDEPLLQPKLVLPVVRKLGRCVGRVAWRPRLVLDWRLAHQYFEIEHNNPLDRHGNFSATKFVFTHSLAVAAQTIFCNEDFRLALAAAAGYVARNREK